MRTILKASFLSQCGVAFAGALMLLLSLKGDSPAFGQEGAVVKAPAAGTYTDAKGERHAWTITSKHALLWEGTPYFPVGGRFSPRSFSNPGEATWQEDVQALAALKAKGIEDLLIWTEGALLEVPAVALQRLVEHLDANGFRYGLSFGTGMAQRLTGTVVKPSAYRFDTRESLTAQWSVPNTDRALYQLVDASNDNLIVQSALLPVQTSVLTQPIEPPAGVGRTVALLYPHKTLPPGRDTLPDLWGGFDFYRDRLIGHLKQVKFGAGLRFFLDPLARQMGLGGETDYLIPESSAFLLEFEAYLTRQYPNPEEIKQNWGLLETDIRTHTHLARLIPLWANGRGIPYYYDPVPRQNIRLPNVTQSRWWQDFLQFRNESTLYYMNAMANLLKRQIAEVPVVYTWGMIHPIFLNPETEGGYDGLSVALHPNDDANVSRTLAPAYSALEQSRRNLWSLVTEINGDTPPANASSPTIQEATPAGIYGDQGTFQKDFDITRRAGFKGYFAGTFQTGKAEDWLKNQEALSWLQEAKQRTQQNASAFVEQSPSTLTYPIFSPGPAKFGFLPNGVGLWLGKFVGGETLDWWPSYMGYTLGVGDERTHYVVQSLRGPRKTHFLVTRPKEVRAYSLNNQEIPIKIIGKDMIELMVDDKPTVLRSNKQRLFPIEATVDTVAQLTLLSNYAMEKKLSPGLEERSALAFAKNAFQLKNYELAFFQARNQLEDSLTKTNPFIWLEGEKPLDNLHTFSEVAQHPETSSGSFLKLATSAPPNRFGYSARYGFNVIEDGTYTIWLAGSAVGPQTSPIQWSVNTEKAQEPKNIEAIGSRYLGDRYAWRQLGVVNLKRGQGQRLTVYIIDRAPNGEYNFSLDAIMLTPKGDYSPKHIFRPIPVDLEIGKEDKYLRQQRGN